MNAVLSGVISGLVSGLVFGIAIVGVYAYEKYQARQAANNIVNNLKSMYYDKVASSTSNVKSNKQFN